MVGKVGRQWPAAQVVFRAHRIAQHSVDDNKGMFYARQDALEHAARIM